MSSSNYRIPNTNSYIALSKIDDVEFVDPTECLLKCFRDPIFNGLRITMHLTHPELPPEIVDKVVGKLADEEGANNFKVLSLIKMAKFIFTSSHIYGVLPGSLF
jgi:hypothetical protein